MTAPTTLAHLPRASRAVGVDRAALVSGWTAVGRKHESNRMRSRRLGATGFRACLCLKVSRIVEHWKTQSKWPANWKNRYRPKRTCPALKSNHSPQPYRSNSEQPAGQGPGPSGITRSDPHSRILPFLRPLPEVRMPHHFARLHSDA